MIGHYLLTLTVEQEDRVLMTAMLPGAYKAEPGNQYHRAAGPCLIGATQEPDAFQIRMCQLGQSCSIEDRFDGLCVRFGVPRTAAAIRNRILSNRARRILARDFQPELVGSRPPRNPE